MYNGQRHDWSATPGRFPDISFCDYVSCTTLCWLWKFLWFYNDWSCIYQIVIVFFDRLPRLSEGWRARRVNSPCSFWKYRAYGKVPGLSSGKWICPLILPQARKSIRGLFCHQLWPFRAQKYYLFLVSLSWCLQKGGGTTVAMKLLEV